ncbi:uncharacterized protein NEMAJ01_0595 [Nematocida major]|uniref:uncharacterized protein n=1 Tax=Nematocida major TaxID=1912982 RepID=UPI0020084363|nr:uncharacterized protein NEMAJ01_0595 [Nematocida major]KAH9385699.1 hypothetical protein NEMAJ01_0595 [Nematocida major]
MWSLLEIGSSTGTCSFLNLFSQCNCTALEENPLTGGVQREPCIKYECNFSPEEYAEWSKHTISFIDNSTERTEIRTMIHSFLDQGRVWKEDPREISCNRGKAYTMCMNGPHKEMTRYMNKVVEWVRSIGLTYTVIHCKGLRAHTFEESILTNPGMEEIRFCNSKIYLDPLLLLNKAKNVKTLHFEHWTPIIATSSVLESPKNFEHIENLRLTSTSPDGLVIPDLFKRFLFPRLKTLHLRTTGITNLDFLNSTNKSTLEELCIENESIERIDMSILSSIPRLDKLTIVSQHLDKCQVEKGVFLNFMREMKSVSSLRINYDIYRKIDSGIFPMSTKDENSVSLHFPTYYSDDVYFAVEASHKKSSQELLIRIPCEIYWTQMFEKFRFPFRRHEVAFLTMQIHSRSDSAEKECLHVVKRAIRAYRNVKSEYILIDINGRKKNRFDVVELFKTLADENMNVSKVFIQHSGPAPSSDASACVFGGKNLAICKLSVGASQSILLVCICPRTAASPADIKQRLDRIHSIGTDPEYQKKHIEKVVGSPNYAPGEYIDVTEWYEKNCELPAVAKKKPTEAPARPPPSMFSCSISII